ncbi:hypothetical protein Tco_1117229, partial [Tanacetum coccineum]
MLIIQAAEGEEPIPTVISSSHQKTQTPRQALKEVTEFPQTSEPIPSVPYEVVYEEWDDRVGRATTTAASLDADQASGNITKAQPTAIPNVSFPQGIGAGGSPRCQEAMGGSIAQTRSEKVPTQSYDSPILRVNTLGSDEGSMILHELTDLCIQLLNKVESLETELKQTKQTYGAAFTKHIKKVKKLEQTGRSMIEEIDQDARITLVQIQAEDQVTSTQVSAQGEAHTQQDQLKDHLRVFSAAKVLADAARKRKEVVHVHSYTGRKRAVSTGSGGISTVEELVSTAGASMPVSTAGMVQEVSIPSPVATKDKGKANMQESEQPKKIKKRVQIQMSLDEELAQKLHEEEQARFNAEQEAKFNAKQEELLASETTEDEANPLVADIDWDDVQAQIQADEDLAQRMLEDERESLSNAERARLLAELIDKRKKLQAVQRYEAIKNKPKTMSHSTRTAETELDHDGSKRQKTNEALESIKEQPDEEEKELSNIQSLTRRFTLKNLENTGRSSGDDLVKLWSLVKERFSSTEPTDDKERTLWVELKRLFEPDTNAELWKLQ